MTARAPSNCRRKAAPAVGASLLVFAAAVANWDHAVLRFTAHTPNAAFLLAALALPGLALVVALLRLGGWVRVAAVVLLALPLAYGGFFAPFVAMELASSLADGGGRDASFELVAAVPVEGGRVGVYRTNCGAPCSFGIAVRQERELLPGLLLVRGLGGFSPAEQATAEALGPRAVRVSVPAYGPERPTAGSRTYAVTPAVYF